MRRLTFPIVLVALLAAAPASADAPTIEDRVSHLELIVTTQQREIDFLRDQIDSHFVIESRLAQTDADITAKLAFVQRQVDTLRRSPKRHGRP